MKGISAGILLFRKIGEKFEVLLVHPGGPFWTKKDLGAWSIPKGEIAESESPETAARREFEEELGSQPEGELIPLGEIRQKAGKIVHAWALEGDLDVTKIRSNTFQIEWPPRSGKMKEFPEVDRAAFFSLDEARQKINPAQAEFIDRLERILAEHQKSNR
jgi:predicted NUDIX family NTP pyrophosphohydrolase